MINQRSSRSISLGTGHYLSRGGGGGGGGGSEDFGGDHLILGEQRGGSVVFESSKGGGSLKILEGFRGGTTQICLNNASLKAVQHKCVHSAGRWWHLQSQFVLLTQLYLKTEVCHTGECVHFNLYRESFVLTLYIFPFITCSWLS